ncbi:hypothetical protein ACC692_36700, partial [Rhizobium ruizarguesonis]
SIISDNLSRLPGATGILPYHKGGHMIGTALMSGIYNIATPRKKAININLYKSKKFMEWRCARASNWKRSIGWRL